MGNARPAICRCRSISNVDLTDCAGITGRCGVVAGLFRGCRPAASRGWSRHTRLRGRAPRSAALRPHRRDGRCRGAGRRGSGKPYPPPAAPVHRSRSVRPPPGQARLIGLMRQCSCQGEIINGTWRAVAGSRAARGYRPQLRRRCGILDKSGGRWEPSSSVHGDGRFRSHSIGGRSIA